MLFRNIIYNRMIIFITIFCMSNYIWLICCKSKI
nr:MAG TPA: hypothetical protein [Caudoviricetes sp.]DAZ42562.1 MAG TPA: hypothetical protein [Caudoviricetes sp.]